jgi:hypothetical protein
MLFALRFLQIFSEITIIRMVRNSTLKKNILYCKLPNHTITIGMCFIETQLSALVSDQKVLYPVDVCCYIE